MSNYSELLKHPKWQKKRLEILERDKFEYRSCMVNNKTLHVHHLAYDNNYKTPWDYPDYYLITLCQDCHTLLSFLNKSKVDFDRVFLVADCLIKHFKKDNGTTD